MLELVALPALLLICLLVVGNVSHVLLKNEPRGDADVQQTAQNWKQSSFTLQTARRQEEQGYKPKLSIMAPTAIALSPDGSTSDVGSMAAS